ncbi:transcriptional regulator [Burkholderia aenigmatica]|uniref:Transcriptional regulator n=1 Tax=Burkholderia aenigmatica TaxID=2015348 RepID=A0A6P2Q2V3_9BURK|nr:transcriptional regulator [Burkholderia aenigmatica]
MSPSKDAVSHHDAEVAELRADPELLASYWKIATESLDDPDSHAAALHALQAIAEAGNRSLTLSAPART